MGRLHKNIQFMLKFFKTPSLVLHFSYYTLMTFRMMLPVILLSMLITLYSKCDQASDLWEQLDLGSERESDLWDLWTGAGNDLLISMLEKLDWLHLIGLVTLVLLMWKRMGLLLRKTHLSRCWGYVKLSPRKLKPWFVTWSFFFLTLLRISINLL